MLPEGTTSRGVYCGEVAEFLGKPLTRILMFRQSGNSNNNIRFAQIDCPLRSCRVILWRTARAVPPHQPSFAGSARPVVR